MNVTDLPSCEMFRPSSDFDAKLVLSLLGSIAMVPVFLPLVVIWSRKIGAVTPNAASALSFLNTSGKVPLATAVPPPGNAWPAVTVLAVPAYTVRETMRLPGATAWAPAWALRAASVARVKRLVRFMLSSFC